MSVFERTNWIAAQADKEYFQSLQDLEEYFTAPDDVRLVGRRITQLRERVERAISPLNLRVHYKKNERIYLPPDPAHINVRLYLDHAAQMQQAIQPTTPDSNE
jgi:hypothetical protein